MIDVDWTLQGRADLGPAPWPQPENFDAIYNPAVFAFGGYTSMAQVLWSGLDNVAVAVSLTRADPTGSVDVALLGSADGGVTWTGAPSLVSIPFIDTEGNSLDSGGGVVPGSVHASLRHTPERTSSEAGAKAIPILVLWENGPTSSNFEFDRGWWMVEVVFGPSGAFVPTSLPTRVPVIPSAPAGQARATLLGWTDLQGDEVVEVAWSERPGPLPACPTDETVPVTWKTSATLDFGEHWICLEADGCDAGAVTIDTDGAFRPCAGTSFAPPEGPAGTPFNPVSDRPELGMSRENRMRFVTYARSTPAGMGVVVRRDDVGVDTVWSPAGAWEQVWASPEKDEAGNPITDAFGPALAVVEGRDPIYFGGGQIVPGIPAIPAVTYRAVVREGLLTVQGALSLVTGESGTWSGFALAEETGVPWEVNDFWGAYQGVAAMQPCLGQNCNDQGPSAYPHVPLLAAWVDGRSGSASEVRVRRFPFGK